MNETAQVTTPNTCPRYGFTGLLIFTRHDEGWITEVAPQDAAQVTEHHVPILAGSQYHHAVRDNHPALKTDQMGVTVHTPRPVLHATLQTLHHELGLPVR